MPELHQILGSLFSDIAKSVFMSDLYSRDISRYYEVDGLLRHFPVPRTEISELELNLKFAISNSELSNVEGFEQEASLATVFLDFSYNLSESFYKELLSKLDKLKFTEEMEGRALSLRKRASSGSNPIYLRQELMNFFQQHHGSLIEKGKFQTEKAQVEIRKKLHKHLENILKDHTKTLTDLGIYDIEKDLIDPICKAIQLEKNLGSLREPSRSAWNQAGLFKLNVEIDAEKLAELDTEQLSSVHVRTRVRNYKWVEIDHEFDDDRTWRTLNPE